MGGERQPAFYTRSRQSVPQVHRAVARLAAAGPLQPFVQPAWRKCLHLYVYFLDRQLGLIYGKLQTWFPFPRPVSVNGHEWLARRLDRHGVRYCKRDNVFLQVRNCARAQHLADVALAGRRVMAAAIKLREVAYPSLYAEAA